MTVKKLQKALQDESNNKITRKQNPTDGLIKKLPEQFLYQVVY